jgi:hypothetical protein
MQLEKIKLEEICDKIEKFYDEQYQVQNKVFATIDNIGGKIRKLRGDCVERIADIIFGEIAKISSRKVHCFQGIKDYIDVSCGSCSKKHQVDRHVYVDSKLCLVVECKSYLDSCYYTRTCCDFSIFKQHDEKIKCYILSLEDSLNPDTKKFYDEFFKYSVNDVYFLCDGKRSSIKPIYNQVNKKRVCRKKLTTFIRSMWELVHSC